MADKILLRTGLEADVGVLDEREPGFTEDTQRPVIGSATTPKFISTEQVVQIDTQAPAAIAEIDRSFTSFACDLDTAGGDIALDITNGAATAPCTVYIHAFGSTSTEKVVVEYASGQFFNVFAGYTAIIAWDGLRWFISATSALAITYTPAGFLTATDVQSALDEVTRRSIEYSKAIGELFFVDGAIKAPAEYTPATPRTFWPALCLDDIDTYEDLDVANWPDLVPFLRAKKYKYLEGLTGAVENFESATYQVAANVVTLTLANNAANIAVVAALSEDYSLTGYRQVINIPTDIGPITAGDYLITGYTPASRIITFAFNTGNTGPSATAQVVTFHANRIVGSTTTARVYRAKALAVMSAGTAQHISGGMRRSYMQGHKHDLGRVMVGFCGSGGNRAYPGISTDGIDMTVADIPSTDGTHGTPRTSSETEPRSITAHLYEWAGSYIAP